MTTARPAGAEAARLIATGGDMPWKKWGPYLSERQWGTVREDYSDDGDAWNYFTHDQARSRVYRWGEDGLAGISDDHQRLCFALALWNERDPILKERAFGLANAEGNHGEDVKEYYFYLDSSPTHSYMKYLYKYPQAAYPYTDLVETNRRRGRQEPEYELIDTGVFEGGRYFDVFVEYAKANPEDLLIRISVVNRGPDPAPVRVLPTLWFRNTWSGGGDEPVPILRAVGRTVVASHVTLGEYALSYDGDPELLFTENENNVRRLWGRPNPTIWVKDAFHSYVVAGDRTAVNPAGTGTKAAAHYAATIGPGETMTVRLRLTRSVGGAPLIPFDRFDETVAERVRETDEFYDGITPPAVKALPDRARVMRQAFAGMLWSKQYYYYDLHTWLREHGVGPDSTPAVRACVRNGSWYHMLNADIVSMPDKWEYPWYAAWDLAFHALPLASLDPQFAKSQIALLLRNEYLHPNGQIPAYEWNFSDVNPPAHAYAVMQIYLHEKETHRGKGDLAFLRAAFEKLLLNHTWWVNRKDRFGSDIFEGGFLGLDNIAVFDRSAPLPTGGYLEQADGTAWMAFFSQQMMRIAVELALHDPHYEQFVSKFAETTMWIAGAMDRGGNPDEKMWDDEDGFFYDVLRLPDGHSMRLRVRSMVGLLPLAAVAIFDDDVLQRLPTFRAHALDFMARHPELARHVHMPTTPGMHGRRIFSIIDEEKLRRILSRMLDEDEFLSPHGIRALSRYHRDHPFTFQHGDQEFRVSYTPGDSDSAMFGGNSNWRGPVWMPVNFMLYMALLRLGAYYGDAFTVECPTGSGRRMNLTEVARDLAERLIATFELDADERRPVFGGTEAFRRDPHWRDLITFSEYFHGDSGAGLGASHQTGWTGCISRIIQTNGLMTDGMIDERD